MEGFKKNQYRISKPERIDLKMKSLDLDSSLEICTKTQKQAAEALTNLKSETSSYQQRQKDSALVKGGFAILTGVGGMQIVIPLQNRAWRVLLYTQFWGHSNHIEI